MVSRCLRLEMGLLQTITSDSSLLAPSHQYLNINHLHTCAVTHSQHPGVGSEICPAPGRRITEGKCLRVLVD